MEFEFKIFEYADGTFKIGDNYSGPYGYTFKSFDAAKAKIDEFVADRKDREKEPIKVHDV